MLATILLICLITVVSCALDLEDISRKILLTHKEHQIERSKRPWNLINYLNYFYTAYRENSYKDVINDENIMVCSMDIGEGGEYVVDIARGMPVPLTPCHSHDMTENSQCNEFIEFTMVYSEVRGRLRLRDGKISQVDNFDVTLERLNTPS